jgi:DNA polymerase (family 10)
VSRNAEVADLLDEYADLLDAQAVEYKPRAYRRAADNVRDHPEAIEDLAAEGVEAVQRIEGIGAAISEKVVEYFETGEIEELEEERAELPVNMAELTSVEGVGPKTVGDLYRALEIRTLDDLEAAARKGDIRDVSGFGAKTEENILEGIEFARQAQERDLLGEARPLADQVLAFFGDVPEAGRTEVGGSLRRWRETIGDVDVLVESEDLQAVVDAFAGWERANDVIEAGENKASIRLNDVRVDLRVVVPDEFGSALQYFTGSKEHNIRLRNYAIARGYKINEYGVFDISDVEDPDAGQRVGERVAGETEESMYEALDLPWMAPELREDQGEIDAAEGRLPALLELGDVRGDLHLHTDWSDGRNTVAEMVEAAASRGYDYLSISDHASGPGIVSGLEDDDLLAQLDEIRAVDDSDVTVFAGVETNVDADGGITVGDDVLAELDVVVASPPTHLDRAGEEATVRLVAAVAHPHIDILGHPSGRLINGRPGMEFDVREVARAAAEHDTALEVNANPHRLDLRDRAVRMAIEEGATISINTDAHSPPEYGLMRYGVHTARRGWAEADDVLNTWSVEDLRAFLHR